jgi:hypothetical protein
LLAPAEGGPTTGPFTEAGPIWLNPDHAEFGKFKYDDDSALHLKELDKYHAVPVVTFVCGVCETASGSNKQLNFDD